MVQSIYTSLNPNGNEIRLLTIYPSPNRNDPINCTLSLESLPPSEPYKALSYVWGDPQSTIQLSIDESELMITTNLYKALRYIRHPTAPQKFWIDALCINQADMNERSQQVMLMSEIFIRAESVVAWLGEEEDDSTLVMMMIERFAAAWAAYANDGINPGDSVRNIDNAFDSNIWAAINCFFERAWWKRLWIYQEVVLAQDVSLMCGEISINWIQLHQAFTLWSCLLLPMNAAYLHIRYTGPLVVALSKTSWTSLVTDRVNRAYQLNSTMLGLLRSCIRRESTDLRDRIYAVMSMAQDAGDFGAPDYDSSVEEVYTDFARTFIKRDRSLALLCYARSGLITPEVGVSRCPDFRKLPSWVPHWIWGTDTARIAPELFDATPHTTAVFRFEPSGELHVQGVLFDTITHVEPPPFLNPQKHRWVTAAVKVGADSFYPTGITRIQALFRTLLMDCNGLGTARLDTSPDELFSLASGFLYMLPTYTIDNDLISVETVEAENKPDYVLGLLRFLAMDGDKFSSQELLARYFGPGLAVPEVETDLLRGRTNLKTYSIAEARATRCRSLFTTEKGFIGLSSSRIRDGDRVCIIPGCPLPLTMRKDGETNFQHVGECFVLGLMDGEALKMVEQYDGQVPFQELCLR